MRRAPRGNATLALVLALGYAAPEPEAATVERPTEELRALLIEAIESSESFDDRFDAEVWLVDMAARLEDLVADPSERFEILRLAHREARRNELAPEVVLAVIQVESNFDRFAISTAGARGLMQVMPFWLEEIGHPRANLFRIRTNLRIGCTILRYYLDAENGHLANALARYNGSVGEYWYPQRVFEAMRTRWYRR